MALAQACDPSGLVDAMAKMLLGLASISTNGQPEKYLDFMRANLDQLLDDAGME